MTAARSRPRPAISSASPSRRWKTASAKRACRATRPSACRPGWIWKRRWKRANWSTGVISGKVKGGLTVMVNGIRAFLPGSLVDIRPVKDTTPFEGKTMEFKVIKLDRKRNNVVVSRRAVLEASQGEERAEAAADPVRRRGREGHRQEHHRLRRVRRPGRHRRPAAHHRPRLAPRQASVRSAQRRRRSHGQDTQVRPGEEPRVARHEAAGRRPVGRPVAPLSDQARACSARSPTSPTTARLSKSSRASKAWCTCPRWTGPTRTCIRPRWCSSATRSRS